MKKSYSSLFVKSAIALALASPMLASAESQLVTGAATATGAAAKLNFAVVIPKVLYLAVGSGSASLVPNTNVDIVSFDFTSTPTDVGSGTDKTAPGVNVRVLGNNGAITIAAGGSGSGLTNGTDVIPWTEILQTSSDATDFNVPAVGGNASPTATGKITNRTATWNYAYSNTNVVAPGTYEGQITYTATMP